MRYLYLIQQEKVFQGPPPARLMEEMGKLMGRRIADGSLLDTAGLMPIAQAVRVTLKRGKLSVLDGPFAETKEIVGGYAFFKFDTRERAIEALMEFMELHRLYAEGEIAAVTRPSPVVDLAPEITDRARRHEREADVLHLDLLDQALHGFGIRRGVEGLDGEAEMFAHDIIRLCIAEVGVHLC
mgnify:CR=1 FL=1